MLMEAILSQYSFASLLKFQGILLALLFYGLLELSSFIVHFSYISVPL